MDASPSLLHFNTVYIQNVCNCMHTGLQTLYYVSQAQWDDVMAEPFRIPLPKVVSNKVILLAQIFLFDFLRTHSEAAISSLLFYCLCTCTTL